MVLLAILFGLSTALLINDGVSASLWSLLAAVVCAGLEQHGWTKPLQHNNDATLGGSLAPVLLIAMITRACWL